MGTTILDQSSRCQAVNERIDRYPLPRRTISMDIASNHSFNQMAGKRLRAIRKFHRLTQQQCADVCKISLSTWSKWESGSNPIDPELIGPFVTTHTATLDWLFYERDTRLGAATIQGLEAHFEK